MDNPSGVRYPACGHFVIKLRCDVPSGRLAGRLEHLPSGRRHDFDSPRALVSCLLHELSLGRDEGADGDLQAPDGFG